MNRVGGITGQGSTYHQWNRVQPWGAGQDCGVPRAAPGLVATPAASVAHATRWQQEPVADHAGKGGILPYKLGVKAGGAGGLHASCLVLLESCSWGSKQGWRNPGAIPVPKQRGHGQQSTVSIRLTEHPSAARDTARVGCLQHLLPCIALTSPLLGSSEFWVKGCGGWTR